MRYEDASEMGSFTADQAEAQATLTARNDVDVILAGNYGPATGNTITGSGTISGSAGADMIAAGGSITAIQGAGGTDTSFSGGKLQVAGEHGVLTIDAQGNYSYVRNQGSPNGVSDVFSYTLAGRDGGSDVANLTINIGKTPTVVQANAVQVVPGPDGVVTLPPGVELSDIHVVGRNLVIDMPDGTQMIIVDGAVFVPQLVLGTVEVPASNLAALLVGSEPTPAAGPPQSSGGNFAVPVAPLDPGSPLGDLIPPTALFYTPPEFVDVANAIEEDEDNPVLITNLTPSVSGGDATVDEDDLPAGSDTAKESLTVGGNFTIFAPDGVNDLTIGSLNVIVDGVFQAGASIVTPLGNTLTVTGYDAVTGVISYTYRLGAAETHANGAGENSLFENFAVTLTDLDGDVDADTLSVNIIDDVPTANDDVAGLLEGGANSVTIDVDTNDVPGADGTASRVFASLTGTYGNLTLNADGTQTYTLTAAGQLVIDALPPGATRIDTFNYTLTDGDGDSDPATLTVTLTGTDDPPLITGLTPSLNGGEAIVDEDDLADGSDTAKESLTVTGNFTISAPDGVDDLVVGGINVIVNGVFVPGATGLSPLGNQITFTGYNAATGVVSYSYTLLDNEAHASGLGENSLFDNLAVTLSDVDGDVDTDTLSIQIVDDVPTANNDAFAILEGDADNAITFDVDLNDVPGADGTASRNFTSLTGVYGNLTLNGDGTQTYTLNALGIATINALPPGATLNDNFTYTLTDGDGDSDPATLVITLTGTDDPVLITNLTPSLNGGEAIVDEDDLADGSDTVKESLTVTGNFTISAPDGVDDLVVGGVNVIVNGVFVPGATGLSPLGNQITFTGYNAATGVVSYSYTLLDNEAHASGLGENSLFDEMTVTLTDVDGDVDTDTLSIQIVDDVPTANNDAFAILEGDADNAITFDVDLNDVPGADGTASRNFTSLAGTYGNLTLNGDGTQTYTLNAVGMLAINALPDGATLNDNFTYTLTDGDGDSDPATLVITLTGTDDPVLITNLTPAAEGGDAVVDEDDLADGSDTVKESLTTTGDFTISAPDGVNDLQVGGINVIIDGVFQAGASGTTPLGNTITFTAYNAATGVVSYSYTLLDNEAHANANGENSLFDDMTVALTDTDNDLATATLSIRIIDDVPTANNDTVGQVTENAAVTFSVFGNDVFGADGVDTDNNPAVRVTFTQPPVGQGTVSYNAGTGQFTFTPAAGQEGSTSFTYTIVDGDGDPSTATVTINLQPDSVPIVTAAVAAVDDDGLAGGNAASVTGDLDANAGEVPLSASEATYNGTFVANFGGDTGTFSLAAMHGTSGSVGTETVNYTYAGNVLTATGPRGVLFTVTVNPTTGAYTVQLVDNVLHAAGLNENDATAALTFTASDSDGDSTNGTLTITFDDDAPTAVNDTVNQVGENSSITFGVFGNDAFGADGVDTDNNPTVAVTFTQPPVGQGTVSYNAGTGQFTFTPAVGQQGSTSFTYTIIDGDGDPSTATVTINLTADSVPIVTAAVAAVDDDGLAGGNAASVTGDLDANAGEVPLSASEATYNGTFVANFGGDAPGTFSLAAMHGTSGSVGTETVNYTYAGNVLTATGPRGVLFTVTVTPSTGAYTVQLVDNVLHAAGNNENDATAALTFTASDNDGDSTNGTLTITFDDDAPTAVNDTVNQVGENSSITFGVFGNDAFGADGVDTDNNPTVAVTFTQPPVGQGTVSYNAATGQFTFTPAVGQQGSTSFTYTIIDGDGDPSTATVTINLQPDSVPIVTAAIAAVDDDGLAGGNAASVTGDLDANAGEVPLSASEATYNGTFVANFGGDTPGTFSLAAMHGTSGSVGTETVNYTYAGNVLTATGPRGVLFTVTVNPTTGAYTVQLVDNVLHAAGNNENDATAALTFTASDNDGDSTNGTLTITFDDDAPTAVNDTVNQVTENSSITFGVFGNDAFGADGVDTDNNPTVAVTFTQPPGGQGTVSYNAGTGQFTFTPAAGQQGSTSFTYTIIDGDGDPSTATVTINLQPDSVPIVTAAVAAVDDDGLAGGNAASVTGDLNANAGEVPLSASEAVYNGTFVANFGGDTGTFSLAAMHGTSGSVGTETVNYTYAGNVLTATGPRGVLFTVAVTPASGAYTVTLVDNVLHAAGGDENDATAALTFTASDSDGDSTNGTLTITFDDDMPSNFSPVDLIDQTNATPTLQDNALVNDGTANVTRLINDANNDGVGENFMGADGFGSLVFSGGTNGAQLLSDAATPLTAGGLPIFVFGWGTGTLTATTDAANTNPASVVFTATLSAGAGFGSASTYTIDFNQPIDDGSGFVFDDFSTAPAGQNLWIGLDSDGNDINVDDNNSQDVLITATGPGGTVNTSSSDIGSNNQWVDAGEGIRVDFVVDVRRDGANDEKDAQGYLFDGHYNVTDAAFTVMQGGPSAIRIQAVLDPDTGNIKTLGGPNVPIDASSIVVTNGGVTVPPAGYTVYNMGDGSFVITGLDQGDNVAFDTNGAAFNAILITSADGVLNTTTPAPGDTFSGSHFAVGEFGFSSATQGDPLDITLGVTATDADGDTSTGTIDFTLVPAPIAAPLAAAITSEESASAFSSLSVMSSDTHQQQQHKTAANNNTVMIAALAAGVVAGPVAAERGDLSSTTSEAVAPTFDQSSGSVVAGTDGASRSALGNETKEAAGDESSGSSGSAGSSNELSGGHSLTADNDLSPASQSAELLDPTEAAANLSVNNIIAPMVSMPSAEALIAARLEGGESGGSQANTVVGKVLVDALEGGGADASVDALLEALPAQGLGENAAVEALASQPSADVSAWDTGHLGGYAAGQNFTMEAVALHHDAVQPVANG